MGDHVYPPGDLRISMSEQPRRLLSKAHSLAVPGEHSCPHFVPFKWVDLLPERTADSTQRHSKGIVTVTQDPLSLASSRLLDPSREQSANEMGSGDIDVLEVRAI